MNNLRIYGKVFIVCRDRRSRVVKSMRCDADAAAAPAPATAGWLAGWLGILWWPECLMKTIANAVWVWSTTPAGAHDGVDGGYATLDKYLKRI